MVKSKRTEHGAERGLWDGEAHRHYRENFLGQWQPLLTCCRCPGMLSKHRMLQWKGGTLASKNVSSSSLGKPGHVDAVGGAGHSWWWMNVWPWARRQGRGVTCNDKTGKSQRLEDRKVTYPCLDVAGRFNSHRRAAQRLTVGMHQPRAHRERWPQTRTAAQRRPQNRRFPRKPWLGPSARETCKLVYSAFRD